jgi:hypothetical protein
MVVVKAAYSLKRPKRVNHLAVSRPQFGGHHLRCRDRDATFAMVSKQLKMMKKTLPAWFPS